MAKRKPERDEEREDRITDEVIVDCYDEHERAMGWCAYLEEKLQFPFKATCIAKRSLSPLKVKQEVEVIGFAGDESERDMFVTIRWGEDEELAVPLSQLKPNKGTDEETVQAVEDWLYWVEMGYEM